MLFGYLTHSTHYIQIPDKHLCKDTEGALTDAQLAVAKASRCSGPAMLAKVWQLNLSNSSEGCDTFETWCKKL